MVTLKVQWWTGTPRRIWARQGPIFYPNFFRRVETQNVGKAQALGALPAVAALLQKNQQNSCLFLSELINDLPREIYP